MLEIPFRKAAKMYFYRSIGCNLCSCFKRLHEKKTECKKRKGLSTRFLHNHTFFGVESRSKLNDNDLQRLSIFQPAVDFRSMPCIRQNCLKKTLLIIVQLICSMAFRATPLLMKSFDVTSTNATLCFRQHCRVKKESESSPLRQFQFYSSAETIKSWQIHRNHQRPGSIKRYFRNC